MPARRPVIDRVIEKCVETTEGCWEFTGYRDRYGYGKVGSGLYNGHTVLPHRVTYAYFIAEIPSGMQLDHLCRNRACCNPWHLDVVTNRENQIRGINGYGIRTLCRAGLHDITDPANQRTVSGRHGHPVRTCQGCFRVRLDRVNARNREQRVSSNDRQVA